MGALGDRPGVGRTTFLFEFRRYAARRNGCLHATRRVRDGRLSLAFPGFSQFFSEQQRKELTSIGIRPRLALTLHDPLPLFQSGPA